MLQITNTQNEIKLDDTTNIGKNKMSIRVIIVDKQKFFKEGLSKSLKVLEGEPARLINIIDTEAPTIIMMEIENRLQYRLELCRNIVRRHPGTSVIILTDHPTNEELNEVAKSGAAAYLKKDCTIEEMTKNLKQVCLGIYPINDSLSSLPPPESKEIADQLKNILQIGKKVENGYLSLSPRQKIIIEHVARGRSNKQIARALNISEQTIKNQLSSIFLKLGTKNRAQAVVMSIISGFVPSKEVLPPMKMFYE